MTEGLIPRGVRAAVFAAACVMLSAGTRAVAAPGAITLWSVLIGLAAVYLVALAGARRERGLAAICGLAVAVQLGLDVWFSAAQVDNSIIQNCGLAQALPQMNGSINCGSSQAVLTSGALHMSPMLLIMQLVVAIVCAWPLFLGESAQHYLWLWLTARGLDLRTAIAVALAMPLRTADKSAVGWDGPAAELPALPRLMVRFEVIRRGPPVALGAAVVG